MLIGALRVAANENFRVHWNSGLKTTYILCCVSRSYAILLPALNRYTRRTWTVRLYHQAMPCKSTASFGGPDMHTGLSSLFPFTLLP